MFHQLLVTIALVALTFGWVPAGSPEPAFDTRHPHIHAVVHSRHAR